MPVYTLPFQTLHYFCCIYIYIDRYYYLACVMYYSSQQQNVWRVETSELNQGYDCWYSCFLGKRCILVVKVGTAAKHLNNHVTVFRCHKLHHWISTLKCCVCVTRPVCRPPPPNEPNCVVAPVYISGLDERPKATAACTCGSFWGQSCHCSDLTTLQFYKTCWHGKVRKGPCRSSPSRSPCFYTGDEVELRRGTAD